MKVINQSINQSRAFAQAFTLSLHADASHNTIKRSKAHKIYNIEIPLKSPAMDTIPLEIAVEILKSCQDIHTTLALSTTCSSYQTIYRNFEAEILSTICWNEIRPEILPLAITVLEKRTYRSSSRQIAVIMDFLADFSLTALEISPTAFTLERSKSLLQFHQVVTHYMKDYVRTRLSMLSIIAREIAHGSASDSLEEETIENQSKGISELSRTEYLRLSRAFYLIELHGELFFAGEPYDQRVPAADQARLFLNSFKDWELEEFLCVRKYLISKLRVFLDRVEDRTFADILHDDPDFTTSISLGNIFFDSDWFFSDNAHPWGAKLWLESCVTRGLTAIKSMLEASEEDIIDAFGDDALYSGIVLSRAITLLQPRPQIMPDKPDIFPLTSDSIHPINEAEDYKKSNAGWVWVWRNTSGPIYNDDGLNKDKKISWLQNWGYAIWDYKRLHRLGVIQEKYVLDIAHSSIYMSRSLTAFQVQHL